MTDKLGQEITLGCWIAYGVRSGNSGDLKVGKVVKVENNKISVLGIDDWGTIKKNTRTGILPYPNKVVVLPDVSIPEIFKQVMES